jgi:5-methylcytosine-specific restriction endonuclease McrA
MTKKERRERRLATKRKYNKSAKGKAAIARYVASDKHRATTARWAATEDGKASARERMRKWRERNPELARERNRESLRKWREENREAYRIHCRKRRKLEHEAEGKHTAKDIKALYLKQRGICLCGDDLGTTYHVDHKTPLVRGGIDWPKNIQLLCPPCNHSKRDKTMQEWRPPKAN